ncbi:MAG: hypothetical protein H0U22_08315 [Geodermatophilaceae bacterium]|nr:hypothetical protein [Geodermatophilaceae bacterium]
MRALSSALSLHKPASRRLRRAAIILIASGTIHLVVLLAFGLPWAGAVSLRKPITFGLSMGLLLWTVGWVIDQLPPKPRSEKVLGVTLAWSGVIEVALITMQAWRGVPSHFNYSTVDGIVVFVLMGIAVAVLSVGLLVATWWTFRRPLAQPTVRLAVRAGMLVVLTGLGIGEWIIELGNDFFERVGAVPDQVLAGEAGVPTFPHAVAFHGIQLFILAAILTGIVGLAAKDRQRVVRQTVGGYSLLLLWSVVQTAAGRAPSDVLWPGTVLAVIGAGLLGAAAVRLFVGWRRSETSVRSETASEPVRYQTGTLEPARETDTAVPSVL